MEVVLRWLRYNGVEIMQIGSNEDCWGYSYLESHLSRQWFSVRPSLSTTVALARIGSRAHRNCILWKTSAMDSPRGTFDQDLHCCIVSLSSLLNTSRVGQHPGSLDWDLAFEFLTLSGYSGPFFRELSSNSTPERGISTPQMGKEHSVKSTGNTADSSSSKKAFIRQAEFLPPSKC